MLVMYFPHGLFLTCIQKFRYLQVMHCLLGEPASLLVVTNTHPSLSLVCQQLPHPLAFTPLTLSHLTVQITLFT
jgi:hypothetical protein